MNRTLIATLSLSLSLLLLSSVQADDEECINDNINKKGIENKYSYDCNISSCLSVGFCKLKRHENIDTNYVEENSDEIKNYLIKTLSVDNIKMSY